MSFESRFAAAPLGTWSAPGRVNLIGEHTDYNEGFVLPFAIDRRTVAALARRGDRLLRLSSSLADTVVEASLDDLRVQAGQNWSAYPLGVVWAFGQEGVELSTQTGFDVHFASDVPVGAGLSSSAALEGALAVALNEVWDLGFDPARLVTVCHRAENDFVGAPTGILDQCAALLSVPDAALLIDCQNGSTQRVDLKLRTFGLTILVVDTGSSHSHLGGEYAARRASCEQAAEALGVPSLRQATMDQLYASRKNFNEVTFRRARHILTENQRVLDTVAALGRDDPASVGEIMFASHQSMRDDFEISTPALDLAVAAARGAGALGARMTGGGFGGCAIALVPTGLVDTVRDRVVRDFSEHGYRPPEMFSVQPSPGAGRDL